MSLGVARRIAPALHPLTRAGALAGVRAASPPPGPEVGRRV